MSAAKRKNKTNCTWRRLHGGAQRHRVVVDCDVHDRIELIQCGEQGLSRNRAYQRCNAGDM